MHHHAPSSTTVTKSTEFYCISRSICSFFACGVLIFFFSSLFVPPISPASLDMFKLKDLRRRQIGRDLPVVAALEVAEKKAIQDFGLL